MIGPRGSVLRNRELWLRERAVLGEMISSFDIAITWVTPKVSTSCVTRSLLTSPGRHRHIVARGTLVRAELLRIRISNSDRPAHFVIAGYPSPSQECSRERRMDPRIIPDQVGDRRPGTTRVFVSTSRSTNTTSRSRGLICPRFARDFLTLPSEGAGNTGRPMRPIAACAMSVVERTRVSQVTPESPGIPRAMVYGLFRALPGDRAFLPPSPAKVAFRELDAGGGASGPHVFAVRFTRRSLSAHPRPPHPSPRS